MAENPSQSHRCACIHKITMEVVNVKARESSFLNIASTPRQVDFNIVEWTRVVEMRAELIHTMALKKNYMKKKKREYHSCS